MNIKIIKAPEEYMQIISNLLQFYTYDFSEYTGNDTEPSGLFGVYPDLEKYWNEENRFPYIIKQDEKDIGFVFVRQIFTGERNYFSIAEFFVMRKYRRKGIGRQVAIQILDLHRGQWEIFQMESNTSAQAFWRTVILDYTKGQFSESVENKRTIQVFDNHNSFG
ncbi:MAG TPA: GNAT family N-acetyltransferase [Puia sp.]